MPDDVVVRQHRRGEPARDVPDDRDTVGAQVEDRRREQAADDQHERPRDRGDGEPQREDHRQRDDPDEERCPVGVSQRSCPRPQLAPGAVPVGGGAGQLGELADDDVDGRAGEESGDDGLGEELGDPAELQQREEEEQDSRSAIVIAATSCAAWSPPRPVTRTAPPATAASEELGPVEICRDVQNTA